MRTYIEEKEKVMTVKDALALIDLHYHCGITGCLVADTNTEATDAEFNVVVADCPRYQKMCSLLTFINSVRDLVQESQL